METEPTSFWRRPAASGVEIAHRTDGALQVSLKAAHRTLGSTLWPSPGGEAAWVVLAPVALDALLARLATHLARRGIHTFRLDSWDRVHDEVLRCDLACGLDFLRRHGVSRLGIGGAGGNAASTLRAYASQPELRICTLVSPAPGVPRITTSRPVLIAAGERDAGAAETVDRLSLGVPPLVFRGAGDRLEEVAGDLAAVWVPAIAGALR